jgi:hypothetical protein
VERGPGTSAWAQTRWLVLPGDISRLFTAEEEIAAFEDVATASALHSSMPPPTLFDEFIEHVRDVSGFASSHRTPSAEHRGSAFGFVVGGLAPVPHSLS